MQLTSYLALPKPNSMSNRRVLRVLPHFHGHLAKAHNRLGGVRGTFRSTRRQETRPLNPTLLIIVCAEFIHHHHP